MSTLGFPPHNTTYSAGTISPFDVAGITAAIDRAASSLKPEERGALTVQLDPSGFGAGLIVRAPLPLKPVILATVTKPMAGRWGWSLQGRVAFLASAPPKPVRVAPVARGLYRLFRARGVSPIAAAAKALAVALGYEVRLDGEEE